MDGNSTAMGRKGISKIDGLFAGKKSKKSGSDDATSREISGEFMNIDESGRAKKRKVGFSKGDGDEVGGNSNATGLRGKLLWG